jgi:hypothetical protein
VVVQALHCYTVAALTGGIGGVSETMDAELDATGQVMCCRFFTIAPLTRATFRWSGPSCFTPTGDTYSTQWGCKSRIHRRSRSSSFCFAANDVIFYQNFIFQLALSFRIIFVACTLMLVVILSGLN